MDLRAPLASSSRRIALAVTALAALLAGCGDGSGSASNGGTGGTTAAGGSGGSGGMSTTTTTPSINACPVQAESHVAAILLDPSGNPDLKGEILSGTISGAGIDTPPTFNCGSGDAWVEIAISQDKWLACFEAPNLSWNVNPGDTADLVQAVDDHPPAPSSTRMTLRVNGGLVVHVEQSFYEADVALPGDLTVAKAAKVCASPDDACQTEGYDITATSGGGSKDIAAGESGDVGAFSVYVDRYWTEKPSSGCDGGDADIRLAVTPAPPM